MKFEYILDTFAWVEYFQGTKKGEIVKNLIEAHKTATPIIVLAELADSYLRMGENIENREKFILSNSTIINLTTKAPRFLMFLRPSLKNIIK